MPWFKIDDNLAFHHKVVAAGNAAMGLWVRAGAMSAQQLTDGFVPDHMVNTLGSRSLATRLVASGLWDEVDGGYTFHEWAERQPSREQVETERAAARDRMASRRKNKTGSGNVQPNKTRSSEEVQRPRPDPTRPVVPNGTNSGSATPPEPRKRAHQLPDNFAPNETNERVAAEHGVDLQAAIANFSDHHRAKGTTYKDWNLALNTWIRRERPSVRPNRPTYRPPDARDVEQPPDGLSPAQYAAWELEQRARRQG